MTFQEKKKALHRRRDAERFACKQFTVEALESGIFEKMLKVCRAYVAWSDSEQAGPDYGGQDRDTHPDGERIWKEWWDRQLRLCDQTGENARAVLSTLVDIKK